ncbi:MAG: hypothetical protein HYS13_13355 [Planctomycetia bacterium]|nr:hypothetical protein [Planctomycetia bacterium]
MSTTEDLWGELPPVNPTPNPRALLREQASLLSQKTRNVLEGTVRTALAPSGKLVTEFGVRCPALDNYEFQVLSLWEELPGAYPVTIRDHLNDRKTNVSSEATMRALLKQILTSERIRNAIASLLREAQTAGA